MEKKRIGSITLTVSVISMFFLFILMRTLSFFDALSDQTCFAIVFLILISIVASVVGLALIMVGKKETGERYSYRPEPMRCSKCNSRIDISKAVRPCVVKCKKCNNPILLDIEPEDVKVQCPKCRTQQVQHIEFRPAEVPCKSCGVTLMIPRKY